MVKIHGLLELLSTLIISMGGDTIKITRDTLSNIKFCLQDAHENIEFLRLESQLQQEGLQQKSFHFGLVFVQNMETNSHQQQDIGQGTKPNTRADLYADVEAHTSPPKPIIRPWEQIVHNKHIVGLGYDKDFSFHIPDYSKPIKFQSVRFVHDNSPSAVPDPAPLP